MSATTVIARLVPGHRRSRGCEPLVQRIGSWRSRRSIFRLTAFHTRTCPQQATRCWRDVAQVPPLFMQRCRHASPGPARSSSKALLADQKRRSEDEQAKR